MNSAIGPAPIRKSSFASIGVLCGRTGREHCEIGLDIRNPGKTPPGASPVVWIGGFRRFSKTVAGGNPETVVDFLERVERDPELWLGIRNLTLPVARLRAALPFA
jgi:hypothetical protein